MINDIKVAVHLDTMADVNCISANWLKENGLYNKIRKRKRGMYTIQGEKVMVQSIGTIVLKLEIKNVTFQERVFEVFEEMPFPINIGRNCFNIETFQITPSSNFAEVES